jgi:hypothetical protein
MIEVVKQCDLSKETTAVERATVWKMTKQAT